MKRIVVLGNGFDLACGLKTSFYDCYKTISKQFITPNGYNSQCNLIIFLIYSTFFASDSVKKAFQSALNIDSYDNWMDIELLLNHFALGDMFKVAEKAFNNEIEVNYSTSATTRALVSYFKLRHSLCENFELFVNEELYQFEILVREYLRVVTYNQELAETKKEDLIERIAGIGDDYKIMTFNYTSPMSRMKTNDVNYVHGSIWSEIIIGIEILELKESDYYHKVGSLISDKSMLTKTRQKLSHVAIDEKNNSVLDKDVKKIVFYGHSLGEQDYSYFQSLFDFYDIYSSDVVLEFCYSEYDPNNPSSEVDRQTTRVFKLINKYGETFDNKNHGKNLLHKMLLENRIVFRKI